MRLVDAALVAVARELERLRWAFDIYDAEWRLVCVSEELKAMLGEHDERRLGYGRHIVEVLRMEAWDRALTDESKAGVFASNAPRWMYGTPGGKQAFQRLLGPSLAKHVADMEPSVSHAWTFEFDYVEGELPPLPIGCVTARVRDDTGAPIGQFTVYSARLPPRLLTLLVRGDEAMFERMARLVEPGRHAAAILFADLQASGELSRRLPSAAFFELMRSVTTAIDDVVLVRRGLVGKHAGDGITAFFLEDQLGSSSTAARSAIEAARGIGEAAGAAAEDMKGGSDLVSGDDVRMNVGVHWGPALYVGQIVTGGRLEVTALGDEVNEAARVQQSARDGEILASKSLIEQLSDSDARDVGVEPDTLRYRTIATMETASEKAIRDAGGLPVAAL
jgi:class 3 adenylate cyclase